MSGNEGGGVCKAGLRVEVESALAGDGSARAQVVLVLRGDGMPRALITDERDVTRPKFVSFVDLLAMLDGSATVAALARSEERAYRLPALPPGTLLLDVTERPGGRSTYAVTGYLEPHERLLTLLEDGEASTYLVPLPHVVYRAEWRDGRILALSLAATSPDLQAPPGEDTELYRYPFAHVYEEFPDRERTRDVLEGVCWPGLGSLEFAFDRIPADAVGGFLSSPNDADHHELTHNAPYPGFRELLETLERGGGLRHDWLVPCGMTVADLHAQQRRRA